MAATSMEGGHAWGTQGHAAVIHGQQHERRAARGIQHAFIASMHDMAYTVCTTLGMHVNIMAGT